MCERNDCLFGYLNGVRVLYPVLSCLSALYFFGKPLWMFYRNHFASVWPVNETNLFRKTWLRSDAYHIAACNVQETSASQPFAVYSALLPSSKTLRAPPQVQITRLR